MVRINRSSSAYDNASFKGVFKTNITMWTGTFSGILWYGPNCSQRLRQIRQQSYRYSIRICITFYAGNAVTERKCRIWSCNRYHSVRMCSGSYSQSVNKLIKDDDLEF